MIRADTQSEPAAMPADSQIEKPRVLPDGRYLLERPLGKAWLSTHAATGSRMVLKPKASFEDPNAIRQLTRLRHPALPRILDEVMLGEPDSAQSYLVCEYLEGMTFSEWLLKAGGQLTPEAIVAPLAEAARVLSFLHEQNEPPLLHLDLKPEHLVRLPGGQVGLIDFDCARTLPCEPFSRSTIRCTTGYAAPELMTGQPGPESDLYSFGVLMLVLLTGLRVGDQSLPPLEPLCRHLPPALTSIIADCVNLMPERRFQSAAALACALERLAAQRGLLRQTSESLTGTGQQAETATSDSSAADRASASGTIGLGSSQDAVPISARGCSPISESGGCESAADCSASAEAGDETAILQPPGSGSPCRDQLVAVWDQAAFATSLAQRLAESGRQVIALDVDLLNPRLDLLLAIPPSSGAPSDPEDEAGQIVHPGLELALTSLMRQTLPPERFPDLLQETRIPRLRALTGAYALRDYAFHDARTLLNLFRLCRMHADVVVVSCSRFLHDSFACLSLLASDLILIPIPAEPPAIREFNRYLDFLESQYPFDRRKARFIAIDHDPSRQLGWHMTDTLCGGLLAGCIPPGIVGSCPRRGPGKRLRLPGTMADEMDQMLRRLGFTGDSPAASRPRRKPASVRPAPGRT